MITGAGDSSLESDSTATQTGTFAARAPARRITFDDGVLAWRRRRRSPGTRSSRAGELRPRRDDAHVPAGDALTQAGGTRRRRHARVTGTFAWTDGDQAGPGSDGARARRRATVAGTTLAALREDRELVNRGTIDLDDGRSSWTEGASILNARALTCRRRGRARRVRQLRLRLRGPGAQHGHAAQDRRGRRRGRGADRQRRHDRGARRHARAARAAQLERLRVLRHGAGLTGGTYVGRKAALAAPPRPAEGQRARGSSLDGAGVAACSTTRHGAQAPPTDALSGCCATPAAASSSCAAAATHDPATGHVRQPGRARARRGQRAQRRGLPPGRGRGPAPGGDRRRRRAASRRPARRSSAGGWTRRRPRRWPATPRS